MTDDERNRRTDQGHGQRDARAVEDAAENIAPEVIRAQ